MGIKNTPVQVPKDCDIICLDVLCNPLGVQSILAVPGCLQGRFFYFYLSKSPIPTVVFLYTLFLTDFDGLLAKPVPFFPYSGFTAFFTARFAFPVVRDFIDFFMLGFLTPIFIYITLSISSLKNICCNCSSNFFYITVCREVKFNGSESAVANC